MMQSMTTTDLKLCDMDGTDAVPVRICMHPDDYRAHLAWVTAKRIQERISNGVLCEKPVYFTMIGRGISVH